MMHGKQGRAYIGCSGFSYDKWHGMFYPEDADKKHLLAYYARHFNAVEINSSFYGLPKPSTIRKWLDETPRDFRFCFKVSRYITHVKKLNDPEKGATRFMDAVSDVARRKGPLLLQLSPTLKPQYKRLDKTLRALKKDKSARWQVAVECRNEDWYGDELDALLNRHRASLVIHDMKRGKNAEPNAGAPFIYLRYHGPRGDYGGSYGDARLRRDAKRIRTWLNEGRNVYAFFNNDADGYAPLDALRLKEFLG